MFRLFIFTLVVQMVLSANIESEHEENDLKLSSISKTHIHRFVSSWAPKIHNKNYKDIIQHAKSYRNEFKIHLDNLIHLAYKLKMSNVEPIIDFADSLPTEDQRVHAYYNIFNELVKENGLNGHEIIQIAHRIKQSKRDFSANNLEQRIEFLEKQFQIQSIEDRLPTSIKALVWKPYIHLKRSGDSNDYFVIRTSTSNEMNVMSCPAHDYDTNGWVVHTHEEGRYFQFEYNQTGESLSASSEKDKFKVYPSHSTDDTVKWEMILIDDGQNFLIKHKQIKKILFPGSGNASNQCSYLTLV